MAIERTPATPVEGVIEQEPQEEQLNIMIENPDSVAIETEDGGMIIDFDPKSDSPDAGFNSNLVEFIDENELERIGSELVNAYTMDKDLSRS